MGVGVTKRLHLQSQPPMIADELRWQADQFIDFGELEQLICRDPAVRESRSAKTRAARATDEYPAEEL
jgi:hypothetical protein